MLLHTTLGSCGLGLSVTARSKAKLKRSHKGGITMLFYTVTVVFSLLVAVPIFILIYKTDSLADEAVSDSIFDKPATTTSSTSVKKFRVKSVNLDDAKSIIQRKQGTVTPIHEEKPASVDRSFKTVANEEPEIVTELPKIITLESVCKPFNEKVSANSY
ncbi:MAG: hypothetical protein QNK19_14350 [Xanthomonadales bacterium]|nr:hypothetical protein [Xanthomonadales bacterium]